MAIPPDETDADLYAAPDTEIMAAYLKPLRLG
jgi:hypothetical protein